MRDQILLEIKIGLKLIIEIGIRIGNEEECIEGGEEGGVLEKSDDQVGIDGEEEEDVGVEVDIVEECGRACKELHQVFVLIERIVVEIGVGGG